MIDLDVEKLITLQQAAALLPGENGKSVNPQTVWRWTMRGLRGVRLETVVIGGRRYTSREAVCRFAAALTAERDGRAVEMPPRPSGRAPADTAQRRTLERLRKEYGIG